jgi:hypothetical protein
MSIKHFPQRNVRREHWGEYEWRETMQMPRPTPLQSVDLRASRAREVRRLLVWACVSWTLFCIILAAVAVVAVS